MTWDTDPLKTVQLARRLLFFMLMPCPLLAALYLWLSHDGRVLGAFVVLAVMFLIPFVLGSHVTYRVLMRTFGQPPGNLELGQIGLEPRPYGDCPQDSLADALDPIDPLTVPGGWSHYLHWGTYLSFIGSVVAFELWMRSPIWASGLILLAIFISAWRVRRRDGIRRKFYQWRQSPVSWDGRLLSQEIVGGWTAHSIDPQLPYTVTWECFGHGHGVYTVRQTDQTVTVSTLDPQSKTLLVDVLKVRNYPCQQFPNRAI